MDPQPGSAKLATTSLSLSLIGWVFYLGQWCFDFTLGLLLAAVTGGSSALCSTILDVLPFVLWVAGVVTGHAALRRIKRGEAAGRKRAVWGLVLNYGGLIFLILITILMIALVAAGIGTGFFEKLLPSLRK